MKFSVIYEAQTDQSSRENDHEIFANIVEQSLLAEELGFDCIWAVEHTALTYYAHMSAPEIFLPYIAGRTSRIHIGHGVVCLPPAMNHPVKVAERIATLDILSQGRLHFGMGKGGTQQEAGTFGYNLDDLQPMVDESMYLIPRIMVEDPVEHDGTFIKLPSRSVHPKPYQDPHPPLYMATTKPDGLVTAGERGIGALVLGFGGPDEVARKNELYRKAFANRRPEDQVGYRPTEHVAALCPAIVLDDGAAARRIGLRGQRFFLEAITYWGKGGGGSAPNPAEWSSEDDNVTTSATGEQILRTHTFSSEQVVMDYSDSYFAQFNPNHAYGTIRDCIGYVERLQSAGADEILFLWQMGTVPHEAQMETIRNIGQHVIPHFRR